MDDLEVVAGGIMVLGVNPVWTWKQRNLASPALVYPGLSDRVPLDREEAADFLHVVVAALADGHARLRRVFGEVPQTREELRAMAPPAQVVGSTDEEQKEIELMAHFVNNLTQQRADLSKPDQVRLQFKQVKDRMRFEAAKRRNPFYGTGEGFRAHATQIRKFLTPEDFWLLFPSGGETEDVLLPQSVWALMHLQGIHRAIKARRAQQTSGS